MEKIITFSARHLYLVAVVGALMLIFLGLVTSNKALIELVSVVAFFYVGSALVHHYHDKTLTFEVVSEYILLAMLALVILVSFVL